MADTPTPENAYSGLDDYEHYENGFAGSFSPYHAAQEDIEVDSFADFDDQSSLISDTTSLNSYVRRYVYENGRRYHAYKSGKYIMPNDETEQDRLDLKHHGWQVLLGDKLHLAPIDREGTCLDVGTGTGIWAIDFAERNPNYKVIGSDISPIQPQWTAENCYFELDDLDDDWLYGSNHFNFIHSRNMTGAVPDWRRYFAQMYDACKPGGWVEIKETEIKTPYSDDGTYDPESDIGKYYALTWKALTLMGRDVDYDALPTLLAEAGFVNIVVQKGKWPIGLWPKSERHKELGRAALGVLESGFEAFGLALLSRTLGMDQKILREVISKAEAAIYDKNVHSYWKMCIVYAQKPMNAAPAPLREKRKRPDSARAPSSDSQRFRMSYSPGKP